MVSTSLTSGLNASQLAAYGDNLTQHTIKFQSSAVIGCLMQDGSTVMKNIQEVIILVQARLR